MLEKCGCVCVCVYACMMLICVQVCMYVYDAYMDTIVKRNIPSPHNESNPRTPIVQPVA